VEELQVEQPEHQLQRVRVLLAQQALMERSSTMSAKVVEEELVVLANMGELRAMLLLLEDEDRITLVIRRFTVLGTRLVTMRVVEQQMSYPEEQVEPKQRL
jgi:hypothetical protein